MAEEPAAWVVRTGRHGERDNWALDNGLAGGGWDAWPDLTSVQSRDQMTKLVEQVVGADSANLVANYTGQLWALRQRIHPGDLMVLPLKTTRQIGIGRVTGGYRFVDDPDPGRRHVVDVEWIRKDLPRTAVRQDLLFTLGSSLTVFQPTKNDAVRRLAMLMDTGADPGIRADQRLVPRSDSGDIDPVDIPEWTANIEQVARDRIADRVRERFAGHGLAELVGAILRADGYHCLVSPPGPDGGIDIYAGRGPLGLDSPLVLVQVKSNQDPIGSPVVTQLHGVMSTHGADQGLLVAWGGLNREASRRLGNHQLRVRVWDANDVVDAILRTYDQLSGSIQSELPLQRVWMLIEEPTDA